jgi:hypothetical protein
MVIPGGEQLVGAKAVAKGAKPLSPERADLVGQKARRMEHANTDSSKGGSESGIGVKVVRPKGAQVAGVHRGSAVGMTPC